MHQYQDSGKRTRRSAEVLQQFRYAHPTRCRIIVVLFCYYISWLSARSPAWNQIPVRNVEARVSPALTEESDKAFCGMPHKDLQRTVFRVIRGGGAAPTSFKTS